MSIAVALVAAGTFAGTARAEKITVGIVQTVIENTLDQNRMKLIRTLLSCPQDA